MRLTGSSGWGFRQSGKLLDMKLFDMKILGRPAGTMRIYRFTLYWDGFLNQIIDFPCPRLVLAVRTAGRPAELSETFGYETFSYENSWAGQPGP